MAYKQVRQFNLSKMGCTKGMCLRNVRLGFGIGAKYASAKLDMLAQKKAGTLHAGVPPINVSVPVYCDTSSIYEHVAVWDKGKVYSDGVLQKNGLASYKTFGWGELCDGTRVVEWTKDAGGTGFLPKRGYWKPGDYDARIGRLAAFMRKTFSSYTSQAALGNYFGPNLERAIREFQKQVGMSKADCDGCVGPKTYAKLKNFGFRG